MKPEIKPDAANPEFKLDQLLRENERLRGDLLTVARRISHDIKTPLGGIITTNELLKEMLEEKGMATESIMAPIFDSAAGLTNLIERVSFLLKVSAAPIVKERIKMGDVVFRVLQFSEGKILKKNITVSEARSWPEVDGAFSLLEVIWGNFLANALCHAKDRVELGWAEEAGEFRFWVSDNGSGVREEKRGRLFQPFASLHEPDAAHGLGLSIVQRLAELQGGRCGYEPRLEGGACFYFTLPVLESGAS